MATYWLATIEKNGRTVLRDSAGTIKELQERSDRVLSDDNVLEVIILEENLRRDKKQTVQLGAWRHP